MLNRRLRPDGRREFEVTPGRWVTRQRLHQLHLSSRGPARIRQTTAQLQAKARDQWLARFYAGLCGACGQTKAEVGKTMCGRCLHRLRERSRLQRKRRTQTQGRAGIGRAK